MPSPEEQSAQGLADPIGDQTYLKAPQLIHRYKNRALFMPTTICPVHCRYCFRKNELNEDGQLFHRDFVKTLDYLTAHPEIEEIIFTGGDPLILSDKILKKYLTSFSTIPSLKFFRFHSRTPVIIPSRITDDLLNLLQEFQVKLVIHINHPEEISTEVANAFNKLRPYAPLAQSVLLKNVNDHPDILEDLCRKLMEFNIRSYYLHHPDQVKGGLHFYLPLAAGRKIYAQLRNRLPGWAIPQYVVDIPGGHGKVNAFNPETFHFSGALIGRLGQIHRPISESFH